MSCNCGNPKCARNVAASIEAVLTDIASMLGTGLEGLDVGFVLIMFERSTGQHVRVSSNVPLECMQSVARAASVGAEAFVPDGVVSEGMN